MTRKQRIATPLSVARRAKRMIEAGRIRVEPVWYRPVINTPPMADFTKKPAPAHQGRIRTKQTDIFQLQQIARGQEQHFRRMFYKQHPWELARPRILVEEDGADHVKQDWSRIEQVGKALDGESVVQRTLYLMKESKSPAQRIWEVHGFDDGHARGRPLPTLPEYGNIPEVNRDADTVQHTWDSLQAEIKSLQKQVEGTEQQMKDLESEKQLIQEMKKLLKDKTLFPPKSSKSTSKSATRSPEQVKQTENNAKLLRPFTPISAFKRDEDPHFFEHLSNAPPVSFEWEELTDAPVNNQPRQPSPQSSPQEGTHSPSTAQLHTQISGLYSHRRTLKNKISQLESKARKMCRLQPEVAYLQACSEFYLLRQQEETETRIAMEQARVFRRVMGLTVNQREFQKEKVALQEWRVLAEREQTLIFDARAGGRERPPEGRDEEGKEAEDEDEEGVDYNPDQESDEK